MEILLILKSYTKFWTPRLQQSYMGGKMRSICRVIDHLLKQLTMLLLIGHLITGKFVVTENHSL